MKMNLNLGFKMKKLFGKNNVMPLVLVAFLIVMLSMCYRNKNRISAVGNSLFEGFKEGDDHLEGDGDGDTFKGGFQEGGCGDDPDDPTAGCFTGHRQGFRGRRRQGFRGRRQGFRGRREGMEVPVDSSHSHGEMKPEAPLPEPAHKHDGTESGAPVDDAHRHEEEKEAFRGRREGFRRRKRSPRKKLGFFGLKKSGSKKTGFRGKRASRGKQGFVGARFQPNTANGFGSTAAPF